MATKNDKSRREPPKEPPKLDWWAPGKLVLEEYGPAATMLVDHAVANNLTVFSGGCRGVLIEESDEQGQEKLFEAIASITGARSPFADVPIFGRGTSETWLFWPEGAVKIHTGLDNKYDIRVVSTNRKTFEDVNKRLGDHLLPEFVRQPIYSLAQGANGIEIGEVGLAGVPIERDNYEADVVDAFDFIVDDLQRATPIGRLVIIQGEPGTGKTFFIRGLLHEVYDAVFVLIPAGMVEHLAGPNLVPTLIRARSMIGVEKPIVLLIEDADRALVPRKKESSLVKEFQKLFDLIGGLLAKQMLTPEVATILIDAQNALLKTVGPVVDNDEANLAAISALLNASDGILGSALNLRIICTTNAKMQEIDDALLRTGRLSKQVYIGPLSVERAQEVYARLSEGDEAEFNQPMTLSQVYDFFKYNEIEEDKEEEAEGDEDADEEGDEDEGNDYDDEDNSDDEEDDDEDEDEDDDEDEDEDDED